MDHYSDEELNMFMQHLEDNPEDLKSLEYDPYYDPEEREDEDDDEEDFIYDDEY